jgi:hypothetical protein
MPLKEADLKDSDAYKKASRLDLSKLAPGNARFWVYKDVELPNSSGGKQKYPAFLVLLDDSAIRKQISGKTLLCKGTCGIKQERIAFEPTSGSVPYNLLKVSVPLLLGKAVWIPSGKEEDDGAGTDKKAAAPAVAQRPSPAQAPAGAISAAELAPVWSKLVKDVQAFTAAHPERKADLFRDMAAISELLKGNKGAEAKPKMDQMRSVLDAPPPKTPDAPGGQAQAQAQAQASARWSELLKQLQAAATANPERKPELVRVSAGIRDLIQAGKLELAVKQMDAVDLALKEQPQKEDPKEKEYRKRYQELESQFLAAVKNPAGDGGSLRAIQAFAAAKAEAGDFDAAIKALTKLEEALKAKPEEEKAGQSKGEEGEEDEEEAKEAAEFRKNLKARMTGALAQVRTLAPRAGEAPKPQLRFIAYLAGKTTAVLVAKKVGPAMKKTLVEIAGATSGKLVDGDCIFEKNVHTFVLETVPGGLAKKLAEALRAETGTAYKVRVRTPDDSVSEEGESDAPETGPDAPRPQEASTGLVAKRKFLIERWTKIPPQVKANLKAMQDAIARTTPNENAAELTKLSEEYLDDFYDEMKDAIDDDINSGDAQYKGAIAAIQAFRDEIASEPLIQHLKIAKIDVESILLDALAEVEQNLAS